ncbi:hypothetical protein C8R44DRAFT_865937 [Mycena epipterygia]|nr:hypothetical protein C8R44DRAFT_865937 [Mycena epipterygia]
MTIAITAAIQASPLITIFALSLTARQADAISRTLTVPTLNLTLDGVLKILSNSMRYRNSHFGLVTDTWDKVALGALLSANPIFRPAIQYSPDQIDDQVLDSSRYVSRVFQNPPAAQLMAYDANSSWSAALNSTAQDRFAGSELDASIPNDKYGWTLANVPFLASNANPEGGDVAAPVVGLEGISFALGVGAQVHPLAMADAINNHLIGVILHTGITEIFAKLNTLIAETNILQPLDSPSPSTPFTGLNVSSSITNISQALQDFVVNATLGFINTGSTTVDASAPSTDIVYAFRCRTLAVTYLLSFSILVMISGLGMLCLISNGEPSSNIFSQILVATRNPRLDPVAKAVKSDGPSSGRTRLTFGRVAMSDGEFEAVFGLATEQKVERLRDR